MTKLTRDRPAVYASEGSLRTVLTVLILFGVGCGLSLGLIHLDRRSFSAQNAGLRVGGIRRVVCLKPSVTETVFALGCGERVVGVSSFCEYPPEVKSLQRLGGVINPNYERLIALRADLVIFQGAFGRIAEFCRKRDIPYLRVEMDDLQTIDQAILDIGRRMNRSEKAEQLCLHIQDSLDAIARAVSHRERPRVFFSMFRNSGSFTSLTTVGPKGFLSELLDIAGCENIFDDVKQLYPQISKESLLKREPQIIIETLPREKFSPEIIQAMREDWLRFSDVPAVRTGRIYFVPEELLFIPGPRIHEAALVLAKIIHREAFDE
ncbi:MAG: ABC transporter substrate-binding protein [Planctomycetes bacterium]|nr:ABC transporter substrate-binding protein [Planctomycetota bacterium]